MAETRDSSVSRDMLQRFTCGGGNSFPAKPKEEAHGHGRPENVELSLGLSLNGRFGVKPEINVVNNDDKKLFRASSVTDFMNFPVDVELSLARTCSLPPDTETEWWKRKELQSLRRSEAKRKRVEKLKNERVVKGKSYDGIELWGLGSKQSQPPPPPPQSPPALQFSSQGSIVSQGSGGSSGVSDLDSQPIQGMNKDTTKAHESSECNNVQTIPKIEPKVHCINNDTMPCVSTKGEGPDGQRIQGFLYRYGKGEEVSIVCVCHGSFLTPAEFVKHGGGGGDVEHPLRHIIVTSSSLDV